MSESLPINRYQALSPAEDYEFLRRKGIGKIQDLCGDAWTDYNEHDPGITLLEAICHAITDLGYRAGFDIKDILAPAPSAPAGWANIFYTAGAILPCNPVTLTDYRKLVVDIPGVRNAWVEGSGDYEVPVYLQQDEDSIVLTCDVEKGNEILPLKGLYRVTVEFEEDVLREGRQEGILQKVKDKLHMHRNLCEDFVAISPVEYQLFSIDAEIKVSESADIDLVNAQIYRVIRDLFSPAIHFYTLGQMRQKGYSTEEIFEGPLLHHGFIDGAELESEAGAKHIQLSDIISRITDIDGVIAIERLAIPRESQSPFSEFTQWMGQVKEQEKVPRLDTAHSTVQFIRNGDRHRDKGERMADPERVNAILSSLLAAEQKVKLKSYERDLEIPAGEYMNLEEYYPFQRSLPACYGMEERLTGEAAGPQELQKLERSKKLVLQLRGFLLLFEQVMANYLSQLAHVRDLLSFDPSVDQTYFTQIPEEINDLRSLFIDYPDYEARAHELLENDHTRLQRRNAALDHLLSRHGENLSDHCGISQVLYKQKAAEMLVRDKIVFLQDTVQLSNYRGRGFDYTRPEAAWDSDNVEGVKKRVCRLLGMNSYHRKYISSGAIHISEVMYENGIKKFVVKLTDPQHREHLLLQSEEYSFREEAELILNYMLEQGMDRHLYEASEKPDRAVYHLMRPSGEEKPEVVASAHFQHKGEMEKSFERMVEVLRTFSEEENFHLVEHILLRPRINGRGQSGGAGSGRKHHGILDKDMVALLPVPEQEAPLGGPGKGRPEKAPYHFKIMPGKGKDEDNQWRLSVLNAADEEIFFVPETFLFYRHVTGRIELLRSLAADKMSYAVSRNADGYYIFNIMDGNRRIAEGKKRYREEALLEEETDRLIKWLSLEGRALAENASEDEADRLAGLDPYSFHVTVVLPAWPARFRDPGFRHLLEKNLFLEMPAHIYPHVYWIGHQEMRRFEEAYKLWLDEQSKGSIPNTEIVNNLLFILDELRKNNGL